MSKKNIRFNEILNLLALLFFIIILSSCEGGKEDNAPPAINKVMYSGFLKAYNEFGQEVDPSGFEVSIVDSNPLLSSTSNSNGYYKVDNVPATWQRAQIKKAGFGTYTTISYNMTPGPLVNHGTTFKVGEISTSVVSNISVGQVEGNVRITGAITPAGSLTKPRSRQLFISKDPNVSQKNYLLAVATLGTVNSSFTDDISISTLKANGFSSGDKVYIVEHGNNTQATPYRDTSTNVMTYPAINQTPSNVVNVVLP